MNSQSRYLLVAAQGLGDSLESTTIIRSLKKNEPSAVVDVVVTRSATRQLFVGLGSYVDNVIYLPFWERGKGAFLRALLSERNGRAYDASFLAFPSARWMYDVLMLAFAAKRRYAHDLNRTLMRLPWTRSTLVPVREAHNVERNRDLLRTAGMRPDDSFRYLVPPEWIDCEPRERALVVVHIGSVNHDGLANKRWPIERFQVLCERLLNEGYRVSVVSGPDEREETQQLRFALPSLEVFEGPLPDVARFISRAAVVVANDNGIAHLAAGVGTPVVALFGPTPLEFAPFVEASLSLRPSSCPPCFDVRHPVVACVRGIDFACLKIDLTPELVLRQVRMASK